MVRNSKKREMTTEVIIALVPVIAGIVGVWVNLNATVARLKGRVVQLELHQDEFKRDMKELLEAVHKIELMLAKMQAK
jgi:hypothetical protein